MKIKIIRVGLVASLIFLLIFVFTYLHARPYLWKPYFTPDVVKVGKATIHVDKNMYTKRLKNGGVEFIFSDRFPRASIIVYDEEVDDPRVLVEVKKKNKYLKNIKLVEKTICNTEAFVVQTDFIDKIGGIAYLYGVPSKRIYVTFIGKKDYLRFYEPIISAIEFDE